MGFLYELGKECLSSASSIFGYAFTCVIPLFPFIFLGGLVFHIFKYLKSEEVEDEC